MARCPGSVPTSEFGARSTALVGGLFSTAALAVVFGDLLLPAEWMRLLHNVVGVKKQETRDARRVI
jgi:hypothetical protein